jgi:hypothetical protein
VNTVKKINNKISDSFCSFEVSKLLRDKGFDVSCNSHYELALTSQKHKEDGHSGPFGWKKGEVNLQSAYNSNKLLDTYYNGKTWYACSRPTHSLAMEWLRVNFKKWIKIDQDWDKGKMLGYEAVINDKDGLVDCGTFKTPEEAREQGLITALKSI